MKNIFEDNILLKLIKNNTGYSSKNFFLVLVTIAGIVLLSIVVAAIIVDLIHNGTVTMSWADMGMFIGSVSTMFGAVGITKAWSEKFERTAGPDGILGTEDDVYIKRGSAFEYTREPNTGNNQFDDFQQPTDDGIIA